MAQPIRQVYVYDLAEIPCRDIQSDIQWMADKLADKIPSRFIFEKVEKSIDIDQWKDPVGTVVIDMDQRHIKEEGMMNHIIVFALDRETIVGPIETISMIPRLPIVSPRMPDIVNLIVTRLVVTIDTTMMMNHHPDRQTTDDDPAFERSKKRRKKRKSDEKTVTSMMTRLARMKARWGTGLIIDIKFVVKQVWVHLAVSSSVMMPRVT